MLIEYNTYLNINDIALTQFRKSVYNQDLNIDSSIIHSKEKYSWWIENYNEEAYKYSDIKWNKVGFDQIEAVLDDNQVVSISGCRKYYSMDRRESFLRVSMHYYTLKKFRKKYNGIVYIEGGFIERQLNYAISQNCAGIFFTIYPYSSKLKAMVINHTKRRISYVRSRLTYMNKFSHIGSFKLNEVFQDFFYYPITQDKFQPNEIV